MKPKKIVKVIRDTKSEREKLITVSKGSIFHNLNYITFKTIMKIEEIYCILYINILVLKHMEENIK